MRRATFWLGVLLLAGGPCADCAARSMPRTWSDAHYRIFTVSKFTGYRPANQEIDFKNVDQELMGAAIFYETNWRRLKHRKRPFRYSPALRRAALGHATDMVKLDFHSHVNPDDPRKKTLRQRLALAGVTRCARSENVAYIPGRRYPVVSRKPGSGRVKIDPSNVPRPHTYASFAKALVDGWMFSPGHRKNILSGATTYLGCAAVYCEQKLLSARGKVYRADYFKACQNFASKRGPNR